MKTVAIAVLLLAGGSASWAQQRMGAGPIQVAPPPRVQGAVPFRAFGSTGAVFPLTDPFTFPFPSNFATRGAATITAFPGFNNAPRGGFFGRSGDAGTIILPYPYPVYMGGYGDPYGQQPNVIVVTPQGVPPVTINQNFVPQAAGQPAAPETAPPAQSSLAPGPAPAPGAPAEDVALFFIALKDSTIYTAVEAYWVQGGTLRFINQPGRLIQVPLERVDRDLSAKLNQARNLEFRLPPATK